MLALPEIDRRATDTNTVEPHSPTCCVAAGQLHDDVALWLRAEASFSLASWSLTLDGASVYTLPTLAGIGGAGLMVRFF